MALEERALRTVARSGKSGQSLMVGFGQSWEIEMGLSSRERQRSMQNTRPYFLQDSELSPTGAEWLTRDGKVGIKRFEGEKRLLCKSQNHRELEENLRPRL